MSNKIQLQENNAALDGYIDRINAAKGTASKLPSSSGGSDANIVPLVVSGNGTFDENGPVLISETFTGGVEPDLIYDGIPYIKAKTLVASTAVLDAIAQEQVFFDIGGEIMPIVSSDCWTTDGDIAIYYSGVPLIIWSINPDEGVYSAEDGFEPNSVYVVDAWSVGLLEEGITATLTALGKSEKPIDGYMPVTFNFPTKDLLEVESIIGDLEKPLDAYYKRIHVKGLPTTTVTVKPSMAQQIVHYRDYDRKAFTQVTVEPIDLSLTPLLCDIELTALPKTEFKVGDWLDTNDGMLLRHYTDGTSKYISLVSNYIVGWNGFKTVGPDTLIVEYTENGITCRTSYDITVTGDEDSGDSGGNIVVNLQEKTATANGEFLPSNGYGGFSKFTVAIPEFDGTVVIE